MRAHDGETGNLVEEGSRLSNIINKNQYTRARKGIGTVQGGWELFFQATWLTVYSEYIDLYSSVVPSPDEFTVCAEFFTYTALLPLCAISWRWHDYIWNYINFFCNYLAAYPGSDVKIYQPRLQQRVAVRVRLVIQAFRWFLHLGFVSELELFSKSNPSSCTLFALLWHRCFHLNILWVLHSKVI